MTKEQIVELLHSSCAKKYDRGECAKFKSCVECYADRIYTLVNTALDDTKEAYNNGYRKGYTEACIDMVKALDGGRK